MRPLFFNSLRRRLLVFLLLGYLGFSILVLGLLYRHACHEVDELFDEQLQHMALSLLTFSGAWKAEGKELVLSLPDEHRKHVRFQILSSAGELRIRSPLAPLAPFAGSDGFTDRIEGLRRWRQLIVTAEADGRRLWIAEDYAYRDHLVKEFLAQLFFPLLLGLPLLGIWVWISTSRGLAPLHALVRQLKTRGVEQLDRVSESRVPVEVAPLVGELNRLLGEVEQALISERRFTSEAAHELRTPLAALQVQTQVALGARDEAERDHALEKLQVGLARAVHLVEQMLLLARLEPERDLPEVSGVDFGALVEEVCADLGTFALNRHQAFSLELHAHPRLLAQADWLRVLLRNLVDNALRYTPVAGRVRVAVFTEGVETVFQVGDSGPGIPAESWPLAMARFHRLDQSGQSGSGLGLSIVARVAELHHARLVLGQAPEGGLLATVYFPGTMVMLPESLEKLPGVPEQAI